MTDLPELTGAEDGVWLVTTKSSTYVMDLNAGTVTRHPGPHSRSTINDTTRRLRTIERCRVGEGGYWTMKGGGYTDPVDYYWQSTSAIRSIERVEPASDGVTNIAMRESPSVVLPRDSAEKPLP